MRFLPLDVNSTYHDSTLLYRAFLYK